MGKELKTAQCLPLGVSWKLVTPDSRIQALCVVIRSMEHPGHSMWVHIRTPPFPWHRFIFWNTGMLICLHQPDCGNVMVVKCKSLAQSMDTQGLSLLFCSRISFALWDQESDAHLCVMFVEKKWEKKGKQLRRIYNIRALQILPG